MPTLDQMLISWQSGTIVMRETELTCRFEMFATDNEPRMRVSVARLSIMENTKHHWVYFNCFCLRQWETGVSIRV